MDYLAIVERISKIVLVGVSSIVLGYAGWEIKWERLGLEIDQFCFDNSDRVESYLDRETEIIPSFIVGRFSERCGLTMEKAAEVLNENKVDAEIVAQAREQLSLPATRDVKISGYVAFGKVTPESYSQVNFDVIKTDSPVNENDTTPKEGSIIVARWGVNLRQNTTITTGGNNPIIGTIEQGRCARITDSPEILRSQFWIAVDLISCK